MQIRIAAVAELTTRPVEPTTAVEVILSGLLIN